MLTACPGKVTKDPKAKMDYVGFRVKIMGKYGVEIAGFKLPGTHPSTWNVDLARFVWDGLVDRTINFVQMTPDQCDDLAAKLNAERAAQGYTLSRATCSDKGKKRGLCKEKSSTVAGKKSKKVMEDSNDNNTDGEDNVDENSSDEEGVRVPSQSPSLAMCPPLRLQATSPFRVMHPGRPTHVPLPRTCPKPCSRSKPPASCSGCVCSKPELSDPFRSFPANSGYSLYGRSVPTIFLLCPASSVDAQPLGFSQ
ncbi:hypothetical protein DFH08DRAFT_809268 [Mycena albidolilacea]|uniref:Uncharacterized protein n=1 Tax=Mycena albidolilacea TaxID=1033008 RepID=A0AAD7A1K7_9AGAR|nr:hypothetical protein DFH08DRAFT_809268 [Mycena albidolilacea]